MAKIVAAYIAHGRQSRSSAMGESRYRSNAALVLNWQRLVCLFTIVRLCAHQDEMPRLILITDHRPPAINGRLLELQFQRLGVEVQVIEHLWRPSHETQPGDYFIFDAFETLSRLVGANDTIALLSARALVVNRLHSIFSAIENSEIQFVEASLGEIPEDQEQATRDRIFAIRKHVNLDLPGHAIHTASSDFIGFTQSYLTKMMPSLRRIFAKNLLLASDGHDHFESSGEVLAAALADHQCYKPPESALFGHAAAIPDDFEMAHLSDIPIIIPGYGREPNIAKIYEDIVDGRLSDQGLSDHSAIMNAMQNSAILPRRSLFRFPFLPAFQLLARKSRQYLKPRE